MVNDNNNKDDNKQRGLLPPHALLSTPPPEDTSTLTSPWWSEEATAETKEGNENSTELPPSSDTVAMPTPSNDSSNNSTSTLNNNLIHNTNSNKNETSSALNILLLNFIRSAPKESSQQWKERCLLLATAEIDKNKKDTTAAKQELEDIIDNSKACSMICFLKTSQRLIKQQEQTSRFNPFYGTWISVAKTPKRCKEHLLTEGNISKKSHLDYYTAELGEELDYSGEYVSNAIQRTFSPLQHLAQRYINSWKDGSQQAFFSKLWSSMQKGDAFYLVRDSTKRLIENTLNHDKKPSDKK
ncbi:MAG: hypothetical protein EXX96DRAFT_556519 [Benjaminiella poitrasii]|nr:MAG: hypothetical protein EXX96DRAFT_556519 [Benjaminiella poitrasii]